MIILDLLRVLKQPEESVFVYVGFSSKSLFSLIPIIRNNVELERVKAPKIEEKKGGCITPCHSAMVARSEQEF
jgi:hypothetical protein